MTPEQLTSAKIHAIEMVMLFNNDICIAFESKGVTRDELREIFRLATLAIKSVE